MSDVTFETWTLPSTGSFTKRSELTRKVASYTLTDRWADINDGQLVLDGTTLDLDDIIQIDETNHANDVGSVVRVSRNGTPVLHYVATDIRKSFNSDAPYIPVTLQGMEWFLDRAEIKRFDYPDVPSYDPDWIYGASTILKGLSGETANELQEIWVNATTGTFTITDGVDTTDPISVGASASEIGIRLETDITGITAVSVTGDGALKTPYEIEFTDPTSYAQLTIGSNNTDGVISVSTTRQGGSVDERPWHKSFNPVTGIEHGNYQTFQTTTAQAPAGDTYSLQVDLDSVRWPSDYGGAQQIVSVRPGSLYRASVPVYCTQATKFALVIRDLNENLIAQTTPRPTTVPPNTWTTLEIPAFYIPDNVTEIIYRIGVLETTNIPSVYIGIESALLAPGKPADTVGFILRDLLVPINDRQVLTWLTPTWTDAADSTGAAWDGEIALSITRGQSMLQLLEFLKKTYGYAWDIRWNGSAFEWHMYNPDSGGTIQNVTISGRAEVVDSAPVVRRMVDFNHAEAEGSDGQWGESNNAGSQGALGRLERYFGNRQGNDSTQLVGVATQLISTSLTKTAGRRVRLQNPRDLPLSAYRAGDYVTVNLEPVEPKAQLRVEAVTMSLGSGDATETYDVHLTSLVFDPETAVVNTVRGLVRRFDGLERAAPTPTASLDPSLFTSPSSVPPWPFLVAASDSTQPWKDVAAYQCDGVNDEAEIQAALTDAGAGETVLLAPGSYSIVVPAGGAAITMPSRSTLRGIGGESTFSASVYIYEAGTGSNPGAGSHMIRQGIYSVTENVTIEAWNSWTTIPVRTNTNSVIKNCNVYSDYIGIDMYRCGYVRIENCLISMGSNDPSVAPACIRLQDVNCYYWTIRNCTFNSGGRAIWIPSTVTSARHFRIQNNLILDPGYQAILLEGSLAKQSIIDGNIMRELGQWGIVDYGGIQVEATTADGLIISNNVIDGLNGVTVGNGIWLNACGDGVVVHNNHVRYAGDGIRLDDVNEATILDNRIDGPNNSSGHDGIKLTGTGTNNRVEGNRIYDSGSFRWDNGINIATSGMVDSIIVGNDLRGLTGTPITDVGTGTLFTYPNHATYGDNFTVSSGSGPSGGGSLPGAASVSISLPTPTLTGVGPTLTPTPITVAASVPQVTAQEAPEYGAVAYPNSVTVTVSLPGPTVTRGDTPVPIPMFMVVNVPTPTISTS